MNKETGHKKGAYSKAEKKYVEEHYLTMTDKELAAKLNRHPHGLYQYRRKNGWTKSDEDGKRLKDAVLKDQDKKERSKPDYEKPTASLTTDERKVLFLNKFNKSTRGDVVKRTCSTEETKYYKDKWCSYLESLDTITTAEEETLHQAIMEEVMIARYEEEIKHKKESVEKIKQDAIDKGDTPPDISSIDINLHDQLNKAKERHMKLMKLLSTTREQRLKIKGETNINFVTICQQLVKREARAKVGREAAIMSYMQDEEEKRLRDNGFFIGGDI